MNIHYQENLHGISPPMLEGFGAGWRRPLTGDRLMHVLRGSSAVILALDDQEVVGFANALSDGVLMAYLPLLEVRPEYQGKGIGSELVRRMIAKLGNHYGIDLLCDKKLVPFYQRLGMKHVSGMCLRNFEAL
ncbi:MAG TPA: GNAT family N-acetyltransferase [Fimbriimonadaceae bacterium]|nr:GNAT family N-acetyltransferase [Fimbriimonadaceae bacterium]